MNEPLVSVIVPVYNVKDFLLESVHSITNQEYTNLEIILVDDGSTDGSGELCDQLAKEDPRIRVIHQENKGLSGARNSGIDVMTGEFVSFIDSDDAFHPSMIRKMVEAMIEENAEVSECRFIECPTKDKMCITEDALSKEEMLLTYTREDALRCLAEDKIGWYAWSKVYRRECFENVRFPLGHVYEDVEVVLKVFDHAKRVVVIDENLIMYRKWNGSISSSYDVEKIKDRARAHSIVYEFVKENTPEIFNESHKQKCLRKLLGIQYTVFIRSKSKDDKQFYKDKIKQLEKDFDRKNCSFKLKVKYHLFHVSPWLMKLTDSAYVRVVTGVRSIREKKRR